MQPLHARLRLKKPAPTLTPPLSLIAQLAAAPLLVKALAVPLHAKVLAVPLLAKALAVPPHAKALAVPLLAKLPKLLANA